MPRQPLRSEAGTSSMRYWNLRISGSMRASGRGLCACIGCPISARRGITANSYTSMTLTRSHPAASFRRTAHATRETSALSSTSGGMPYSGRRQLEEREVFRGCKSIAHTMSAGSASYTGCNVSSYTTIPTRLRSAQIT